MKDTRPPKAASARSGRTCPSCSTELGKGARFCHKCGVPLGSNRHSPGQVPWLIAGGAVLTLIVVLVFINVRSNPAAVAPIRPAPTVARTPAASQAAPDISRLTPRQRADRLFSRVEGAHERGRSDTVALLTPMALQAYRLVENTDPGALLNAGLILAFNERWEEALAQADSIESRAPDHLFAAVLRGRVSELRSDSSAMLQAYREFLENYEAEIAADRTEYDDRRELIDGFRSRARRAVGAS